MVFGFNNFNMMNMFPMNFGSFGFGSFGCGTGYSNFGSSLFGCGFGNNYLNPTNCDGSTNWGAVGFGLTAAFAPMLLNWGVGAVEKAIQNSNGNQQEVVAGDVETLQSKVDDALAALGSGVTESNYKGYTIDNNEKSYKLDKENAAEDLRNANNRIAVLDGNGEGSISKLKAELKTLNEAEQKDTNAIAAKQEQIDAAELELRNLKADVASPNGKLYKADAVATKAYNDRAEAIRLQKIAIEEAIKQRDKAQAELEELRLDDYDGTAIQRTSLSEFKKIFDIDDSNKDGKIDFISGKSIDDVKKSDIRFIINQYKTATPEKKEQWKNLLKTLWNDNGLDPDIRNSSDCRGGYKLICG